MALNEMEEEFWSGIRNLHSPNQCFGRPCPVHAPSDHKMREWRMHWRSDRGILERICSHGIGHPDPDQIHFWNAIGRSYEARHGCDGCCVGKFDEWQGGVI